MKRAALILCISTLYLHTQDVYLAGTQALRKARGVTDDISVHQTGSKWHVYNRDTGRIHTLPQHDVSRELRYMSPQQVQNTLMRNGYLYVRKFDDGSYALSLQGRLPGGGEKNAYAIRETLMWLPKALLGAAGLYATVKSVDGEDPGDHLNRELTETQEEMVNRLNTVGPEAFNTISDEMGKRITGSSSRSMPFRGSDKMPENYDQNTTVFSQPYDVQREMYQHLNGVEAPACISGNRLPRIDEEQPSLEERYENLSKAMNAQVESSKRKIMSQRARIHNSSCDSEPGVVCNSGKKQGQTLQQPQKLNQSLILAQQRAPEAPQLSKNQAIQIHKHQGSTPPINPDQLPLKPESLARKRLAKKHGQECYDVVEGATIATGGSILVTWDQYAEPIANFGACIGYMIPDPW